ncbi:hypothetical protein [Jiella sonneratiae]|uniref:Antifreeze protein n=1 Tax=Jiella sonneratiae TaxID=2816856 RepID=A0ABS3IXK2_9HYPH|nr:hypothetical protein [Jiella sonneratiae]MBO0902130.1 hypothetical protein [Jiella sonneratiae]
MFGKFAKALCVAAALGSAAVAAPSAASAAEYRATLSIGSGGIEFVRHRGHDARRDHGRHWSRRGCTPGHALNKARRFGLRHAHVRHVSHRSITVAGRKHRHHAVVRFARFHGCPVISYR